ncbi:MAG TPA: glycine cleavage system aminomethyltransferase GcvT [Candidatus Acidoferrales bacterium]|nr:glycine cleavage system aminomethyltransferase GcvT [Candidatus Acidoferrales bacterium]
MRAERTPLYDRHLALGGRLVNFGGWELPQQFTSIKDEHHAVRTRAGLFDISHMGRVEVAGAAAQAFLQGLFTNDLDRLEPGRAQYTLMCNEEGGILDDLVVYRRAPERYLVVFNAANRERDLAWTRAHAPGGVEIRDRTFELSLVALQGPQAAELLPSPDAGEIGYFGLREGEVAGVRALISRTGYTGEDGFELFVDADQVVATWDRILASGQVAACGLGARDACRLEAGLRLHGQDMDESTNPYEAGLGWTVKLQKGEFVGRKALAEVKAGGPARELVGLKALDRSIPRHGMAVARDGRQVGEVTSGTYSFWLSQGIAMARVRAGSAPLGARVRLEVRGQPAPAEVVSMPFYRGSVRSPAASRS